MTPSISFLPPAELAVLNSARKYTRNSKAESTKRVYRIAWADFTGFCQSKDVPALPATPATVAAYLVSLADAGKKPATMSVFLAAISKAHSAANFDNPCSMSHAVVKEVWSGIRRTVGVAQTAKAAATTDYLKQMLQVIPSTITGIRDRAMLLVGFAGALRRSELVALRVEDITFVPEGLVLHIRRSKTDQEGRGESVAIAIGKQQETCPVRALNTWLAAAGITTGPIFRGIDRWGRMQDTALTDKVVALQVKKYAEAAGLNSQVFAGHSLRAGLATSAAIAGVPERKIMDQTRHKSVLMVRRYVREANLFRDNASGAVGL